MKFDHRISRRAKGRRRKSGAKRWFEAVAEANEELMDKYRGMVICPKRNRRPPCAQRTIGEMCRCCVVPRSRTRVQRMLDAVIEYLPSPVDIPPVVGTMKTIWKTERRPTTTKFPRWRSSWDDRPVLSGQLTFIPCLFGRAKSGYGLNR